MSDVAGKLVAAHEIPHRSLRLLRTGGLPRPVFRKPAAYKQDFTVDFGPLLERGEAIAAATAQVEQGGSALVIERVDFAGQRVLVWCVGGVDRARYTLHVGVSTSAGETRSARFDVIAIGAADLVGLGITTAGVAVPERAPPTVLTTDKAFLMFTGVAVNGTSPAQSVALTNNGPDALAISDIAVSAYYEVSHDCPASLGAGASCTINVVAKPRVSGRQGGALTVSGDENASLPLITTTS